jgi:transcriptional regulator with GAF, ATPase, and Fis domain/tetratricopeptide (TPR) repeat protein
MDMHTRSKHHEQMGRIIEARHEDSLDPVLDDLIYHYGGCNNNRRLLECLLMAGGRAETEEGLRPALACYERALAIISEHGGDRRRHVAVLGKMARLNTGMGNLTKARAQFEAALRNSEKDSWESAQITRDMGRMYMVSGDVERAGECFRYAEKALARLGIDDAELSAARGEYYLHVDNLKAAEERLTRARRLAGEAEDRGTLVDAGVLLGAVLLRRGRAEEGITALQETLAAAERSNINRLKLRALAAMVRALLYVGKVESAETYMLQMHEVSGRSDGALNMLEYLASAGEFHLSRGRLEKAQEALERCLSIAKEVGEKRRVCDAYALLGSLNIERDDLKRGIELCERGLGMARSLNSKYRMASIAWLLGGAFLKRGEYDTAHEFLGHSRRIFEKIGAERELSQVFYLLGEVLFRKRELFTARQFLTMAIDRATLLDDRGILARAHRVLAHIYMEEDDTEQAQRCYRESIAIFERHQDSLGLARACQDFGLFLLEYGRDAGEDASPAGLGYLNRAFDLYRGAGAGFLARKAEILLNKFRRRAKGAEIETTRDAAVEAVDVHRLRDSIKRSFDEIQDEVTQANGDQTMSPERIPERLLEEVQTRINEARNSLYGEVDRMSEQNRRLQHDIEFLMEEKNNLSLLQEISRTVNSELDMNKLISKILDMVIEVMQAERGFLILKDKKGKLVIRVARNIDHDSVKKPEFKVSFSIAKRVVKTGEPILTSNAQEDERFKDKISVHDLKLKSVLCVPFMLKEKILGAAYVDNRFVSGLFGERDLEMLNAFCNQAAIALENARLYEENLDKQKVVENLNRQLRQKVNTQQVELAKVKSVLEDSQKQLGLKYDYSKMIGKSRPMQEVLKLLDRVIDTQIPILIQGESGTGKELIARAIHYNGPNKGKPFAAENVAALPDTLLESELFGYKRGAFTGADRDKKGLFEIANGGTLFLDEVAEMSENMQKKLLRVRDRPEDVPLLVNHFLAKISEETGRPRLEIPADVMRLLERYKWPGNVRELENEINRLVALSDRVVSTDSLSQNLRMLQEPGVPVEGDTRWRTRSLKEIERETIIRTLRSTGGNKVEAARTLGIDRTTLYNKMHRYGIEE